METKIAFIGNSHMAYWPLEMYFPKWECLNYGRPGEGLEYVESFDKDVSDCYAVIQFGTNDLYRLNNENMDAYVEREGCEEYRLQKDLAVLHLSTERLR